ncbi:MAG: hypothetical protein ACFE94_05795 [Candidatus Hodarchaeota archaeon]
MSNEKERKERNENYEEDAEKIRWELNEIRDDLMDELDDLHDEFKEEIEDLIEESEEVKDELREELEELTEEREALLNEIGDVRKGLEDLGDNAQERIEKTRERLEHLTEKIHKYEYKLREKVRKRLEKARKKAVKRINISVDPEMSEEWKDWAEGLGASVSELVRKSMKFVKNNIGDISKLEDFGKKMGKMGVEIERVVKDSGIEKLGEKLGEKIEKQIQGKKGKSRVHMAILQEPDKERIKKRVSGLIKLHKSLPIDKLAQAIDKSYEEAENLIYELVAEDIEGELEEGVFKFTSPSEEVIQKLYEMIDNM